MNEINLLRRLEGNKRVIRLIDSEVQVRKEKFDWHCANADPLVLAGDERQAASVHGHGMRRDRLEQVDA